MNWPENLSPFRGTFDRLLHETGQGAFEWRLADNSFFTAGVLTKAVWPQEGRGFLRILRRHVSRRELLSLANSVRESAALRQPSLEIALHSDRPGQEALRIVTLHLEYEGDGSLSTISGLVPAEKNEATVDHTLRLFFEQAPISMFLKDAGGRYLLINSLAERLFRATNKIVRGQPVDAFYPAALAAAVHADDNEVVQSGAVARHEWLIPTGGEQRWFATTKFAIRGAEDEAIGIGGIDVDIHEQKRLEAALRDGGLLFRAVIDAVPAIIVVRDIGGRFVLVNRAFAGLMGVAPEECVGKLPEELDSGMITRMLLGPAAPLVQGRGEFSEVIAGTEKVGSRVWLTNSVPVTTSTGSVNHIVSVAIDITQRKRAEDDLFSAKEAAERANHAKSVFLAAASHDLRQPLQALGLFATALERRVRMPGSRAIMRDIQDCISSMGHLLDALLDVSQLEAGTIIPRPSFVAVQDIFELLAKEFAATAEAKKLKLRVVNTSATVTTDLTLLHTILANLLSNAIRYTPSGRVVLGCRRMASGHVSIEVHDTGVGITSVNLEKVFDDFYQVADASTDRSRGLGLGLAIARRLSNLLQHPISVRSQFGKGSSFAVSVPMATYKLPSTPLASPAPRQRSLASRTILILENDPAVSSALAVVLRDWGASVVEAATVQAALDIVAKQTPDLAIVDYQLGRSENGVDALRRLHASIGRKFPAIILSGNNTPEDLVMMRASGHHVLGKPAQPGRLRALVDVNLNS